ncbi:MAG: hypothetical protein ACRDZS_11520 [Acidimicrobiales bacterium]
MIYGQHIRRLDVNGSHRNRTGDREEWVERTHKHKFSEQHQDTVAYTLMTFRLFPRRVSWGTIAVGRSRRSVESRPSG